MLPTHSVWKKLNVFLAFLLVLPLLPPLLGADPLTPPGDVLPPLLLLPATDAGALLLGTTVATAPAADCAHLPRGAGAAIPPPARAWAADGVDGDPVAPASDDPGRLRISWERGVTSGDWSSSGCWSAPGSEDGAGAGPDDARLRRSEDGAATPRGPGGTWLGGRRPGAADEEAAAVAADADAEPQPADADAPAGRVRLGGTLNPPCCPAAEEEPVCAFASSRAATNPSLDFAAPFAAGGCAAAPTSLTCSRCRPSSLSPSVCATAPGLAGRHVTGSGRVAPGGRWVDHARLAVGGRAGSVPSLKPSVTGTLWADSSWWGGCCGVYSMLMCGWPHASE